MFDLHLSFGIDVPGPSVLSSKGFVILRQSRRRPVTGNVTWHSGGQCLFDVRPNSAARNIISLLAQSVGVLLWSTFRGSHSFQLSGHEAIHSLENSRSPK